MEGDIDKYTKINDSIARLVHSKPNHCFGWIVAYNVNSHFETEAECADCDSIYSLYPINVRSIYDGHLLLDTNAIFALKQNQFDIIADIKQYNWIPQNLLNHDLCHTSEFRDTIGLCCIQDVYDVEMGVNQHVHKNSRLRRRLDRTIVESNKQTNKCFFLSKILCVLCVLLYYLNYYLP